MVVGVGGPHSSFSCNYSLTTNMFLLCGFAVLYGEFDLLTYLVSLFFTLCNYSLFIVSRMLRTANIDVSYILQYCISCSCSLYFLLSLCWIDFCGPCIEFFHTIMLVECLVVFVD